MAELNIFHYMPKKTVIHDMDGRIKLVCMILFAVAAGLAADTFGLALLTSVLACALIGSGLPGKKLFAETAYFLCLIGIVIAVHSFSVPGASIPHLPIPGLSREGLISGLFFGWRLVLIVLLCMILTGTTSLAELKSAIEWFLRPMPLIRAARVATMFSLTFVLIPLVFDQASKTLDAQKARCIEGRKNPIRRIIFLVSPLLLHTFRRAEEMALAMESRCYSEDRTPAQFKTDILDWLLLVFSALVGAVAVFRPFGEWF